MRNSISSTVLAVAVIAVTAAACGGGGGGTPTTPTTPTAPGGNPPTGVTVVGDGPLGLRTPTFGTAEIQIGGQNPKGRPLQLALRHTSGVADTVYARHDLAEAARVFEAAGLG